MGVQGVPLQSHRYATEGCTEANSSPLGVGGIKAATSDSIYALGVTRNLENRIVVIMVNLQSSEFLQFGYLPILENGVSTQVGHIIFSGQFGQTQFRDLAPCWR